jgi:hypothetical protein
MSLFLTWSWVFETGYFVWQNQAMLYIIKQSDPGSSSIDYCQPIYAYVKMNDEINENKRLRRIDWVWFKQLLSRWTDSSLSSKLDVKEEDGRFLLHTLFGESQLLILSWKKTQIFRHDSFFQVTRFADLIWTRPF